MNKSSLNTILATLTILTSTFLSGCANKETTPKLTSFKDFVQLEKDKPKTPVNTTQATNCIGNCQSLRQEFRYVVYVGKQIYCYWDEKKTETGTDFDALAITLENSITNSTTQTEYYIILRRWASAFHDGHVNVMMKEDASNIEIYSAPFRLEALAPATDHEKLVVVQVGEGAEDLKVGDTILSINGKDATSTLDEAELELSGSTKRMRRFFAARRLTDALGNAGNSPITLEVDRNGKVFKAEIPRIVQITAKPTGGTTGGAPYTGASVIKATILPGSIGYLRIDGFGGSQSFFLLDQAMQRLANTKALLIDLRKNGGGDQSGNSILARLIKAPITRYQVSQRMSDFIIANRPESFFMPWTPGDEFAQWSRLQVAPSGTRYDKPIVALISPNCFSACDTFTAALKSNKLATIAGEGSGGGTGTPLVFSLPISSHQFRYSVVRGLTSDGAPIEGAGTLPDVVIEPTVDERINGRDEQLEKAFSLLRTVPTTPSITKSLPLTWTQRMDIAPTMADEAALREIIHIDEL